MSKILETYDKDKNGVIDSDELALIELEDRRRKMEDEDAQRDSIRKMAWYSLFGLLLYPSGIFICSFVGLDKAAELIADIAGTYFIAVSALVASFFGASAYQSRGASK